MNDQSASDGPTNNEVIDLCRLLVERELARRARLSRERAIVTAISSMLAAAGAPYTALYFDRRGQLKIVMPTDFSCKTLPIVDKPNFPAANQAG